VRRPLPRADLFKPCLLEHSGSQGLACACELLSTCGRRASDTRCRQALQRYAYNGCGRGAFRNLCSRGLRCNAGEEVDAAVQNWAAASDAEATALQAAQRLAAACQPLYRHLFVPISQQPGGAHCRHMWLVRCSCARMTACSQPVFADGV
jgi:hypothetical protein